MQSVLLISKNHKNSLAHAMSISQKNKIDQIDTTVENFEKIIGIEDIRNIQKRIFLKPIRSDIKSVVIDASFGLTIEAQNALLKLLEEPPANTIIIITAINKNFFLPTILSRCKIIETKEELKMLSDEEISAYQNMLDDLIENTMAKKMKLAQDSGKSREETLIWLEQMQIVIREKMLEEINRSSDKKGSTSSAYYLHLLRSFQNTYTIIKTSNVNQRFALENLFLNL